METIEIIKFLSIPISIAFAGLWLSKSIDNLAESMDGASTDNYEIALGLTKLIHSDQNYQNSSDKAGIEREYIETYSRVLQKAAEIDYMEKGR